VAVQIVTYANFRLVRRHRGTLPILLTAPHGGAEHPEDDAGRKLAERDERLTPPACSGRQRFNKAADAGTVELTEAIAQSILSKIGLSPYVVIARFARKFVDADRSAACAFTDPAGAGFYGEYHKRIDEYLTQLLAQNDNKGFLFDLHHAAIQASDPADIFIATRNGGTMQPGFDRAALFAQHGLQGMLTWTRYPALAKDDDQSFRFDVSPRQAHDKEHGHRNGGPTIDLYGGRVNAIQIENTLPLLPGTRQFDYLVDALGNAIIHFVRRHAPF
jgi:hypothetical protein